jgi:hypothetical protein
MTAVPRTPRLPDPVLSLLAEARAAAVDTAADLRGDDWVQNVHVNHVVDQLTTAAREIAVALDPTDDPVNAAMIAKTHVEQALTKLDWIIKNSGGRENRY